jgi:hypothetical protein
MLRLIRTDKQAGAQCAVNAYFVRINDIESIEEDVKWHTVHTTFQWKIYFVFYCASVGDARNSDLTMLERLCQAINKGQGGRTASGGPSKGHLEAKLGGLSPQGAGRDQEEA